MRNLYAPTSVQSEDFCFGDGNSSSQAEASLSRDIHGYLGPINNSIAAS